MTAATDEGACAFGIDFSSEEALGSWRIVNDGVMGGRSEGARFHEEDHLVFTGTINTNGGGFSSLRKQVEPGTLSGASGLTLNARSDGRAYRMTFRTSERWRGRSVSYQAAIPTSNADGWSDVDVSFADMDTSVFGRTVQAAPFDPSDVREIGIILADGQDGPFRFELSSIRCR